MFFCISFTRRLHGIMSHLFFSHFFFFIVVCLFLLTWKPTNKAPTNLKEKAKTFERTSQNKNSVVINHQKVQEAPDPYWWTSNQCVQRASEQKTANWKRLHQLPHWTHRGIAVNSEHVWWFSVDKFYRTAAYVPSLRQHSTLRVSELLLKLVTYQFHKSHGNNGSAFLWGWTLCLG